MALFLRVRGGGFCMSLTTCRKLILENLLYVVNEEKPFFPIVNIFEIKRLVTFGWRDQGSACRSLGNP